ncbi:MAG TPA: hypothetical protein VEX38_01265, partial [Fimbriimonadaceae bacterium]|nr:hypothetical protein [Fimbriimonadaceae bacterium]
ASERSSVPEAKPLAERPWRRFSKHFFMTLRPLLVLNDATVARTRLLILEAAILKDVRLERRAPKDLSAFGPEIKTDPYSGQPFVYRADGADYRLHSVGENAIDDAGDTDESFSSPDLVLEKG